MAAPRNHIKVFIASAYSCDFGHPVLTKADTQSRSKRTLVPEDFGH
jgi:hypothetical protein